MLTTSNNTLYGKHGLPANNTPIAVVGGCTTVYITPGSPWENPFTESFNGKFRAESLNRYLFVHGPKAQHITEHYRIEYTTVRPPSAMGYLTPAEFARQHVVLSL